jgi:hypothetical protein
MPVARMTRATRACVLSRRLSAHICSKIDLDPGGKLLGVGHAHLALGSAATTRQADRRRGIGSAFHRQKSLKRSAASSV